MIKSDMEANAKSSLKVMTLAAKKGDRRARQIEGARVEVVRA